MLDLETLPLHEAIIQIRSGALLLYLLFWYLYLEYLFCILNLDRISHTGVRKIMATPWTGQPDLCRENPIAGCPLMHNLIPKSTSTERRFAECLQCGTSLLCQGVSSVRASSSVADVVELAPASVSTRRTSFPSQTAEAQIIPTAACSGGLLDIELAPACQLGLPVTANTSTVNLDRIAYS